MPYVLGHNSDGGSTGAERVQCDSQHFTHASFQRRSETGDERLKTSPSGCCVQPSSTSLCVSKAFRADVVICSRAGRCLALRAAIIQDPCKVRRESERIGEMCHPGGGSSHSHKPDLFGFGNPVKRATAFVAVVFHSSDSGGNW